VVAALTLTLEQPTLANGYVRIDADPAFDVQMANPTGVVPIEIRFLPDGLQPARSSPHQRPQKPGAIGAESVDCWKSYGAGAGLSLELPTAGAILAVRE
jgi:hypothetical protein